jgi:hypothetical protein
MICRACGRHFRVSRTAGLVCDVCVENSRSFRPPRRSPLRREPAACGPHNHPRPDELIASEPEPTVVLVPLDDAKDEPTAA